MHGKIRSWVVQLVLELDFDVSSCKSFSSSSFIQNLHYKIIIIIILKLTETNTFMFWYHFHTYLILIA